MIDKTKWVQVSFWIPKPLKECLEARFKKRDFSGSVRTRLYEIVRCFDGTSKVSDELKEECRNCGQCAFDRYFDGV